MKNFLLILISIFTLISCDYSKKYEGKWSFDYIKNINIEIENPTNILIENDSIKFNYWAFNHRNKYLIKIEDNHLKFNNWDIETDAINDTLILKETYYIKDNNSSELNKWRSKPITRIDLPKVDSNLFRFDKINYKTRNSYVLFGKRVDNNKFSLQLNDKHAEINDLLAFLATTHTRNELNILNCVLFIDKSTPMKYVEDIFYYLKIVNQLKVSLVNDICLNYKDSIGLHYDYDVLTRKLTYHQGDKYIPQASNKAKQPPLPHHHTNFPIFNNEQPEAQFILLKNDTLYYNNKVITISELKILTQEWIKNKNAIFSLYDLESSYGKFLEMTATINLTYQIERNTLSNTKFNKLLNKLNSDELMFIKKEIPLQHIWSYSIPNYNSIVKDNNSFFGLKAQFNF